MRAGYFDDERVIRALDKIAEDLAETAHGPGWLCLPDPRLAFRGLGRKADLWPQVTLEAMGAHAWLAPERTPEPVLAARRTLLALWRDRGTAQPHMFGHGRRFKHGKWPPTWYSALAVVDTLGRFDRPCQGTDAIPEQPLGYLAEADDRGFPVLILHS